MQPHETASLDRDRVREILKAQFADLDAADVRWLGEGYDSTAFEVDRRWLATASCRNLASRGAC
jgi:hypothetical protein